MICDYIIWICYYVIWVCDYFIQQWSTQVTVTEKTFKKWVLTFSQYLSLSELQQVPHPFVSGSARYWDDLGWLYDFQGWNHSCLWRHCRGIRGLWRGGCLRENICTITSRIKMSFEIMRILKLISLFFGHSIKNSNNYVYIAANLILYSCYVFVS